VLIAGGFGAFQMRRPGAGGASWTPLSTRNSERAGAGLHYDYTNDVLVAGSLGRGSWTLSSFFRGGGGTVAAWSPPPVGLRASRRLRSTAAGAVGRKHVGTGNTLSTLTG